MTTYVYCPRLSNGALELVKALGATRLRRFDGMDFWDGKKRMKLAEGDVIICWGTTVPEFEGIRVLNAAAAPLNKKDELKALLEAGLPTIVPYSPVNKNVGKILLPRKIHHQGGRDLLITPNQPDYFVLKENFTQEYRIHSFNGRSIRAGVKVHREGFTLVTEEKWQPDSNLVHPWIRSFDGGWRVAYDGFVSTAKMRKLAHLAISTLKLTFGAVDLGDLGGTSGLKVLEVNRAPGIEGNSITAYARAIQRWIGGNGEKEVEG